MKLSDNKIIKALNHLSTFVLIFYVVFLAIHLFSSTAPGKKIKGYELYNVAVKKVGEADHQKNLYNWFNKNVLVQETSRALVHLRFKTYDELLSLPALLFQLAVLCYWLLIGFLIICIKFFFRSLTRDEVFTKRNSSLLMFASIAIILLPIINWIVQELFIYCIEFLMLNDSGYILANGESGLGIETIVGFALFAFGLAFRIGVNIKNENESFI